MNRIAKNTVVALAFLMAVGTAWAAQTVSETYPVGPGAEVDIDVLSGTVTIVAGSEGLVEVTGKLGDGVEGLEIEGDEDGVFIEAKYREHYQAKWAADTDLTTDLTIRIPAGSVLSVETVSASISVDGVTGELDLESVSGSISIASAPADSDVSSVSGLIEIRAAGGSIDVENVSGKIVIHGGVIDDGDLESVSGDITCHAIPGPDGSLDIETMSGTITLVVDAGAVASYELTTFSGSITNEIGPEPQRTSKYTPGKELSFNTGPGGPRISLESFSGAIKLLTR